MTAVKSGEVYTAEDGTVSTVLDTQVDPNYEPQLSEIEDYADFLKIDVVNEKQLLWVARAGLKAPLPPEWKLCKTDTEEVYYFNFQTGDSIWEHPLDDVFKQKVIEERSRLQLEGKLAYTPPPGEGVPGIDACAVSKVEDSSKKGAPGKKGVGAVGGKKGSLKKGAAGHVSDDDDTPKKIDVAALSSTLAPLNAKGSLTTPTTASTGSLKSLDNRLGGGSKPDVSDILAMNKKSQIDEMLESKRGIAPKDTASILREANKDSEKAIKARLEGEFVLKLQTSKEEEETKVETAEEDNARALKKLAKDLAMELEDQEDSLRRAGERRVKKELQIFEEGLDRQKEDLRRTLRSLRDEVQQKEVELASINSGKKNNESAVAAKKAEIEKEATEQVSKRRDAIHELWHNERLKAEAHTKAKIDALESEKKHKIESAKAESKASVFGNKVTELEAELQKEIVETKLHLASKRESFRAELAKNNSNADPTYLNAERECEASVNAAKAEAGKRLMAARADCEAKKKSAVQRLEAEIATARNKVILSNTSASDHVAAKLKQREAELEMEFEEVKRSLQRKLTEELQEFEHDTEAQVARARAQRREEIQCEIASKQGAEALEAAERKKKLCAQARDEAAAQLNTSLGLIEASYHKKINALEEQLLRLEGNRNQTSALTDSAAVDPNELERAKRKWLDEHPEPSFPDLPSIPAAMSGLSVTQQEGPSQAEIDAVVAAAKATAEDEMRQRLVDLENELERELQAHVGSTRAKAEDAMSSRLESYRREVEAKAKAIAESELLVDKDSLYRKKKHTAEARAVANQQMSSKQLLEAKQRRSRERHVRKQAKIAQRERRRMERAALLDAREVAKILRRRQMRDDLEDERHAEIRAKEAEIRAKMDDEVKKLEQRLEQVAGRLAAAVPARSNTAITSSDFSGLLSSSQFTIGAIPHGSRPTTPQNQQRDFPLPQFSTYHDQSNLSVYQREAGGSSPPRLGDRTQMPAQQADATYAQHNLRSNTDSSLGFTAGSGSARQTPYGSYQNTPVRAPPTASGRWDNPSSSAGLETQESMRAMIAAAQQHLLELQQRVDGTITPPPIPSFQGSSRPGVPLAPSSLSAAVAQGVTTGDMRAVSPSYAHHGGVSPNRTPTRAAGLMMSESERIAKAWATLDKRKRKLREQKERMETARADWRMDMTAAKHAKDKRTIAILKSVHEKMEESAHNLNEDMRDLQSAIKWLKNHETEIAQKRAHEMHAAEVAVVSGGRSTHHHPTFAARGVSGDDELKALLYALLSRTAEMERKIEHINGGGGRRGEHTSRNATPTRNRHTVEATPVGDKSGSGKKAKASRGVSSSQRRESGSGQHHYKHGAASSRPTDRLEGGERRTRSPGVPTAHDPVVNKWSTWLGAVGSASAAKQEHPSVPHGGSGSYPISYRFDPTSGVLPPFPTSADPQQDRLQSSHRNVADWLLSQNPATSSHRR